MRLDLLKFNLTEFRIRVASWIYLNIRRYVAFKPGVLAMDGRQVNNDLDRYSEVRKVEVRGLNYPYLHNYTFHRILVYILFDL